MEVQVEIKDKNGKVIKRSQKKLCRSYLRQLIDFLQAINSTTAGSIKDTSGNAKTFAFLASGWADRLMSAIAPSTNTLYGILVGTGASPVNVSDFAMQTLIAHGDTSTKLNYGAVSVGAVAIVGSTAKFTIARTLTNNSGADINVTEIGLVEACSGYAQSIFYAMIEHTLLSFTVVNGTSGTVTYTISVTV